MCHISRTGIGQWRTVSYKKDGYWYNSGLCRMGGTGTGSVAYCVVSIELVLGQLWTVVYQ